MACNAGKKDPDGAVSEHQDHCLCIHRVVDMKDDIESLQRQLAEREEQLKHLTEQAGPDSCADLVRQLAEARAEIANRDKWHAAVIADECSTDEVHCGCVAVLMAEIAAKEGEITQRLDGKFSIRGGRLIKESSGEEVPMEGEPLLIFRGRDRLALPALMHYRELSRLDGCGDYHLSMLDDRISEFEAYATSHPTKQPGVTRGLPWAAEEATDERE